MKTGQTCGQALRMALPKSMRAAKDRPFELMLTSIRRSSFQTLCDANTTQATPVVNGKFEECGSLSPSTRNQPPIHLTHLQSKPFEIETLHRPAPRLPAQVRPQVRIIDQPPHRRGQGG